MAPPTATLAVVVEATSREPAPRSIHVAFAARTGAFGLPPSTAPPQS
jgi:hypothetical protein